MDARGTKRKRENDTNFMSGEISLCDYVNSRAAEVESCSQAVNTFFGSKLSMQRLPRHMRRRAMSHNVKRVPRRLREIAKREIAVNTFVGTKLLMQRLPRHMRRRAMSHNVKRVPRRLREIAKREMYDLQKVLTKHESKRPSRKYRRRPQNLLKEYERRKRKHVWLETHIWHAKRFHTIDKWGYRLAYCPTGKSGRAAYRASAKHCLLQDHSYMCCIEIIGSEDDILEGLKNICSTITGMTFAAKSCLSGNREGSTVVYKKGTYPYGAIGPVNFLWNPDNVCNPNENGNTLPATKRQMWIWSHPASFSDVLSEIRGCFDSTVLNSELHSSKDQQMNNNVIVKSLKDKLVRFSLTGPLSQAVLRSTFLGADVTAYNNQNERNKWWQKYYETKEHINQLDVWEILTQCRSPAEAPAHCVIGLTVRDPRLFLPQKRTKSMNSVEDTISEENLVKLRELVKSGASSSPIWLPHVRDDVSNNKETEQKINKMKSEMPVPGTQLDLADEESRIPVLLINRPGSSDSTVSQAYGCGWDIILPQEWARPFFVAMIYRGARAGGLKEARKIASEGKELFFPIEYPDTRAGDRENKSEEEKHKSTYERRPTNNRLNYIKMGVPYPFTFPWDKLVLDWKTAHENVKHEDGSSEFRPPFYILRDKKVLKQLSKLCQSVFSMQSGKKSSVNSLTSLKNEITHKHSFSLIPVTLISFLRGHPSDYSSIYIPDVDDISKLSQDSKYGGPVEPKHADPGAPKRKELKILKQKLKKNSKKGSDSLSQCIMKKITEASESDRPYQRVIDCNSRKLFGYVTSGDYTFSLGLGTAQGFCSLIGLFELFEHLSSHKSLLNKSLSGKCLVLTRSRSSLQYRFSHLGINV